jgi:hypothetical protein
VTSSYVRGPVRFPVARRLYRRYAECPRWEAFVHNHFPDRSLATTSKERTRLHKEVDAIVLAAPAFQELQAQWRTKLALGIDLWAAAIRPQVPFSVLVFESCYLAEELVSLARYDKKDWLSLLKKHRNLETNSFGLKAGAGQCIPWAGPPLAVADLVPLIPPTAYRAVTIRDKPYWTFTLAVRIGGLGKGRLVVSFANAELTGTYAVLVTKRGDWSAQRIIALYVHRWPIEPFYQEGKGPLGLDEYRMRNAAAIGKHGCLVCVADALLHLDCFSSSLTKARFPLKTSGEAGRQQAQALREALILYAHERLHLGQSVEALFASLFAKPQTALAR